MSVHPDYLLLAARAPGSESAEFAILLWMLLGVIGHLVTRPFRRRIGGIDPRTGRPGGSEAAYVGTVWFVAALVTGLYMSH